MAASSFTCHDTSPLRGERTGIQSYKERGLLSGHLGTVPVNSARKTPHLPRRRGRAGEDRDLLPQGEALQPGRAAFSRGDRFWKLHFYFGLVFTHHACEQKEGSESRGCCGYVHTCPVHAAPHCVYSSRLRVKRATSPTAGSHGCCPSESLRGEMCVTVPPHLPRSRFSDTLCSGSHAKIKNKRGIESQAGKPHRLFFLTHTAERLYLKKKILSCFIMSV